MMMIIITIGIGSFDIQKNLKSVKFSISTKMEFLNVKLRNKIGNFHVDEWMSTSPPGS
jgi:hypothetical protein